MRDPETLSSALTCAMKLETIHQSTEAQKESQRVRYARVTHTGDKVEKDLVVTSERNSKQPQRGADGKANGKAPVQKQLDLQDKEIKNLQDKVKQMTLDSMSSTPRRWRGKQEQMCGSTTSIPEMARELTEMKNQTAQGLNHIVNMITPNAQKANTHSPVPSMSPTPMLYGTDSVVAAGAATPRQVLYQTGYVDAPRPEWHARPSRPGSRQAVSSNDRPATRQFRCFECNEVGHMRRACPYLTGMIGDVAGTIQGYDYHRQNNAQTPMRANGTLSNHGTDGRVYVRVKIQGKVYRALLDTGCDATLIPAKMVKKNKVYNTDHSCVAANGTTIPILGWASMQGWMANMPVQVNGLVTEHVRELMLGIDWLSANNITWNFSRGEIMMEGETFKLESRKGVTRNVRRVVLADNITVPPRSQLDVSTKAVFDEVWSQYDDVVSPSKRLLDNATVWGTESKELKEGLLLARTVLPNRVDELPVRLMNTTDQPIQLQKDVVISELEPLQVVADRLQLTCGKPVKQTPTYDDIIDDMVKRVDSSVTTDIKDQLRSMLTKYSSVLSRDELDLGWTDLVKHRIDTEGAQPFRQQMRRYPPAQLEIIDKHLEDMMQQGVIEPAASPYASNVVLAKKKDGTYRCCIDFRQLNDQTRKDAYPLPRADSAMDAMSGSKYYSVMDLRCGFHQVSMEPEDRDKTAFITRRGMYRFRNMPFGLSNAVATFQRLMDLILTGLTLEICLAYLDDIIVFASTPEEHLERLEMVLKRLQAATLKLKPSKCNLMQTSVCFLGHIISGQGVATDPEKIRLIKDWPVPQNLKEVRGYLGLAGYYRKFIKDYARIAAPLHALMKKNQRFSWTEECQEAFDKLKLALMSPPILTLPRDEGMMILDCDASTRSIGAVLSQMQDGQEKVIAYAGRSLSKNEVNYCITRLELLAIVHFTKYFRQYLLGRQFLVRSDHAALNWLRKMKDPIGQNARWLELLGEYDFIVKHRQGMRHSNADALSRHPCLNKPSCSACHPERTNQQDNNELMVDYVMARAVGNVEMSLGSSAFLQGGAADEAASPAPVKRDGPVSGNDRSEQIIQSLQGAVADGVTSSTSTVSACNDDRSGLALQVSQHADCLSWSRDDIIAAQKADSDIGVIIAFMSAAEEKPDWKSLELYSSGTKSLWHEWERLSLRDGVLCRKWTPIYGSDIRWQVVLPKNYRADFVRLVHTGMTGGHLGRSKTEEQVRQRAYWPNWRSQVAMELKKCTECARFFRGKPQKQTPLQPFGAGEPFEIIAIDITGKHPTSARGNQYILTVTCLFSRWSEAYAIRNHTAPVVARVLVDQFFARYGTPKRILSDQGAEFQSQMFRELCKRLEIEQIRTSPYKPSSNGTAERVHRTLNSMLGKVAQHNQKDWDDKLPIIMAAYRQLSTRLRVIHLTRWC